ncbi:MAG: hypothetical protein J6Q39_07155 [Bacteroidales bacterium]|nr:hypothetical protein [Bacteroidales bacterium]
MPVFTSNDRVFLEDLPGYPVTDGKKVLTATTESGETSLTYEEPEAGTVDYSTTEQATGQKWIDGKEIYKLTTLCEIPDNQAQGYTHFVTSVPLNASVVDCIVVVEDSADHLSLGGYIPWYSPASVCFAGLDSDGLNVWFGGDHYKGKNMYVTLFYTKVTVTKRSKKS